MQKCKTIKPLEENLGGNLILSLLVIFLDKTSKVYGKSVSKGQFGADMKISLVNDGPFTIMLDSIDICKA